MKRWNRRSVQPPKIALHGAGRDPDDGRHQGQGQAEQDRDAEPVDHPRHEIAALVVGAEPVVFEVAAAGELLALDHRLALLLGEHPGRLGRRRRRQIEIVGRVGVADRRPDHVAALLGDQLLQKRIAIVGRGLEIAAERGLRIGDEDREIRLAFELDVERLVVRDEFGEQRKGEQDQEDPERPVAAAVGLEVLPAPLGDGREIDDVTFRRDREPDRRNGGRVRRLPRDPGVHLRPPGSRSRCADRPRYRRGRRSGSPRARPGRRYRASRTPPGSRG